MGRRCGIFGMLHDILRRAVENDPVRGWWTIPLQKDAIVWCNASDVALGVVLKIGDRVAEDASWLRKERDSVHINLAELDAVLKGVSPAIR